MLKTEIMPNRRWTDYLVCYDICEPTRLRRVHRCLRGWGTPIQYSVFHCRLSNGERKLMVSELRGLINPAVDDVRVYAMQPKGTLRVMGKSLLPAGLSIPDLRIEFDEK